MAAGCELGVAALGRQGPVGVRSGFAVTVCVQVLLLGARSSPGGPFNRPARVSRQTQWDQGGVERGQWEALAPHGVRAVAGAALPAGPKDLLSRCKCLQRGCTYFYLPIMCTLNFLHTSLSCRQRLPRSRHRTPSTRVATQSQLDLSDYNAGELWKCIS